ncbi:MAG: flavin reductase family protein [Thermoplasmata archaeon]|uniref:Flavin reductase family protein n=1 Tax=Candidatus Sysuiplasma superficiale TaxID=2823368 RepID=A0A8J7YPU9_9ARCH|nr:flavin reductase family protein [Candidatus Sysuiplasma superficiale]MBX8644690.1 flavin reductase family protein [Candidatus Sysuiplasma superficiale]MCL4346832.1 flavin reductase family protein [Candidatus Thermoplasmatota archaeon]
MSVSEHEFRKAISSFPTGVTVIAATDGRMRAGMTANALFSLSLNPPSVVVSLQDEAETTRLIQSVHRAAISFLSHQQRHVSETFAKRNSQDFKFSTVPTHLGRNGQPIIDGCVGAIEIDIENVISAADHKLVVGNVTRIEGFSGGFPLIYFASGYATMAPDGTFRLPEFRH